MGLGCVQWCPVMGQGALGTHRWLVVNCWSTTGQPVNHYWPFLATRAHCWLVVNVRSTIGQLLATRIPKSSTELL